MNKALQLFNLTEKEIAERLEETEEAISILSDKYMSLKVQNPDDKEGYEIVKEARIDIKKRRVKVEKNGKAQRDDANAYNKMVLKVEHRIIDLLSPIEDYLTGQEKIVTDEKLRLKAEAEAKEAARVQAMVDHLISLGCTFDGATYRLPFATDGFSVLHGILATCDKTTFELYCAKFKELVVAENARIEKEKADKLAEEQRMTALRIEQEAKQKELDAQAETQRKAAAEIKAAQDAIAKEKQEIAHKQALENAKVEAAAKSKAETEQRIKKETEEKAAAELKAQKEAEKKAARAPDKDKLLLVANSYQAFDPVELKTDESKAILAQFRSAIDKAVFDLRKKAEEL